MVERFERCAGASLVAGPSTALRFAQDDRFWVMRRRANTEVLHCVQDDESSGDAEENGRALLDTHPLQSAQRVGHPELW